MQIYGSLSIYLCPPFSETICEQARHTVPLLCPPNEGATYSNYRTEGLDQNGGPPGENSALHYHGSPLRSRNNLTSNYHEQHTPFPIHTNPPHQIHYVPIGDGWREVVVRHVIHYVPVLLPNHHL
jgi:hypothetical protein